MSDTPSALPKNPDGCDAIRRHSDLLAEVAATNDLSLPVPNCGDWTLGDLVWHLTIVQRFWTGVTATRPAPPPEYEPPPRLADDELVAGLRAASAGLLRELATAGPDEAAWSWSTDRRVAFIVRRQVHESLVHCVDGLLATGRELPHIPIEIAADGVDEVVRVLLGAAGDSGGVQLEATDSGDRWHLDLPGARAVVSGRAIDLDLWLWGRAGTSPLSVTGDAAQLDAVREAVAEQTR